MSPPVSRDHPSRHTRSDLIGLNLRRTYRCELAQQDVQGTQAETCWDVGPGAHIGIQDDVLPRCLGGIIPYSYQPAVAVGRARVIEKVSQPARLQPHNTSLSGWENHSEMEDSVGGCVVQMGGFSVFLGSWLQTISCLFNPSMRMLSRARCARVGFVQEEF